MKYLPRILGFLLLYMTAIAVSAQSGDLRFINETPYRIDEAAVREAAQPLLNRGARIAIMLVPEGGANDVLARARAMSWQDSGGVQADVLILYVSMEPRYAEIRYGDNYEAALDSAATPIRTGTLNPLLPERQFTQAFSNTLREIEQAIANPIAGLSYSLGQIPMQAWFIFLGLAAYVIALIVSPEFRRRALSSGNGFSGRGSGYRSRSSGGSSGSRGGGKSGGSW
jgi:hypothetical protein